MNNYERSSSYSRVLEPVSREDKDFQSHKSVRLRIKKLPVEDWNSLYERSTTVHNKVDGKSKYLYIHQRRLNELGLQRNAFLAEPSRLFLSLAGSI